MNKNINLVEILKDCPKGWKLYSPALGEVKFKEIINDSYPIEVMTENDNIFRFTSQGKLYRIESGECLLFPSKDQKDWSKFIALWLIAPWLKNKKFDPKTLQPFDKVLVRDHFSDRWKCDLFSSIIDNEYACVGSFYTMCIPYNEKTKHLAGITEEAPDYYCYWNN